MLVIGALAAAISTLVAFAVKWLPDSASEEMDRIAFAYWFTTVICIAIFAVVAAVIAYSVWKFRVTPGDDTDGPPIHGHTGLEIGWTVIPSILVIAIGIASAIVISRNNDPGPDPLTVAITAQQFAWTFAYPDEGNVTSKELVLPVDRGVVVKLTATDVLHSFWIPEMGQKMDAVPGVTTEIVITPTVTGRYSLICTELCGLGHSTMRAPVRVVTAADFDAWLKEKTS